MAVSTAPAVSGVDALTRARMSAYLAGRDPEFRAKHLLTAAGDGLWSIEAAFVYLHEVNTRQSEPAVAGASARPRLRSKAVLRGGTSPAPEPSGCYVPSISFDVVVDRRISDGCRRFLQLVAKLAGRSKMLRTLTRSLAKLLGRNRRTVLNYYREAEAVGFLDREYDARTGVTALWLMERIAPPKPPAPQSKSWPRVPQPRRRGTVDVAASALWGVGAKLVSHVNSQNSKKRAIVEREGFPQ